MQSRRGSGLSDRRSGPRAPEWRRPLAVRSRICPRAPGPEWWHRACSRSSGTCFRADGAGSSPEHGAGVFHVEQPACRPGRRQDTSIEPEACQNHPPRGPGLCAPTIWSHAKGFGQKPCRGGVPLGPQGTRTRAGPRLPGDAPYGHAGDRVRMAAGRCGQGKVPSRDTTSRSAPASRTRCAGERRYLLDYAGSGGGFRVAVASGDGSRLGVSTSDAPAGVRLHGRRSAVVQVHVMERDGATIRVQERPNIAASLSPRKRFRRPSDVDGRWTTSLRPTPRC